MTEDHAAGQGIPISPRWTYRVNGSLPPGPNEAMNTGKRIRLSRWWRDTIAASVRAGVLPAEPLPHAYVTITLYRTAGPPRDEDNAVATVKHVIDGLVVGGLLVNDRKENITLRVVQAIARQKGVQVDVQEQASAGPGA